MARSTRDFEIGGVHYRTTALPATRALDVLARLMVLVGRDMLRIVMSDDGAIDSVMDNAETRVGLMLHVAEQAQNGELSVLRDLFADTQIRAVDGSWQPLDFDEHFSADMTTLFHAAVQVVIGTYTRPLPEGSPSQSSPNTRA